MKSILLAPEDMSTATLLADATQTKINLNGMLQESVMIQSVRYFFL